MCTLSELDCDTFEADEPGIGTISDAANHIYADTATICKKCGSDEVRVSLKCRGVYCKACFLSLTMHKFRATLGRSKSVRPNDSILVGHSGKATSTILLRLIKASENESTRKRLPLRCKILYIDDGMVKGRTKEERSLIRKQLFKEAKNLQLSIYMVSLASCVIGNGCERIEWILEQEMNVFEKDTVVQEMFSRLGDDTARDELLRQLKRKLLVTAARQLECNKIFVGDTSVDLAIKILGDVSTGRGSQLFLNVGFFDARSRDVALIRPLRDFTGDDIINYLNCCELTPTINCDKYDQSFPASIRRITSDFVRRLNSEFQSTVSTICRTGEKMASNTENRKSGDKSNTGQVRLSDGCILCEMPLMETRHPREEQVSVIQAKLFSKLVSTSSESCSNEIVNLPTACVEAENERRDVASSSKWIGCSGTFCNTSPLIPVQYELAEKYFCYGCKSIFFHSNQTFDALPSFILDGIREKLHLMRLQEEIWDFLL